MTGSAPTNQKLAEFTVAVFNCHLIEAYGLTETVIGGTLQHHGTLQYNHVGQSTGVLMKLVDVEAV